VPAPATISMLSSATTLPDGTVLVTGTEGYPVRPPTYGAALRYDPGTDTFVAEGPMRVPRCCYTATRLLTGEVLFVGGTLENNTTTSSAELFR